MLLAAASAWTPAQLNPRDWFNETSSVTDAGGGACSQWDNLMGGGRNLTQATGTARPLIVAAAQNGLRAIRFDGTTDYMSLGSSTGLFQNAGAGWVFAVFKRSALDGAPTQRALFWNCINSNGNTRLYAGVASGSVANRTDLLVKRLDADSTATLTGFTIADTLYHAMLWQMDWTNGDGLVQLNGNSPLTNLALTTSGSTSNTASASAPSIGALINGGGTPISFSDVEIGELIIGNASALSSGDITQLFDWAIAKWALP